MGLRSVRAGALISVAGMIVAACAGSAASRTAAPQSLRPDQTCRPAWPRASPVSVTPGGSVVLTDLGVRCDPFPRPQTYTVVLVGPRRSGGLPDYGHEHRLLSFRVGVQGKFRIVVHLPESVLPGSAQLGVRGRQLDQRLKCPPNASCKYYGAGIAIVPSE
jgi:hypothetical protein